MTGAMTGAMAEPFGPDTSPVEPRLGRRLIAAFVGLALAGTVWALLPQLETAEAPSRGETETVAASRSLGIAIGEALAATGAAAAAPPEDATAGGAVNDAWEQLTHVHNHIQAQLDVAAGQRAPQMSAPPPAPGQMRTDAALLRSGLMYVRTALETRDPAPLHRARELLEMGRSAGSR